jgi:ribosomal-protein-alanine N-acetyltransferase
VSKIITTTERLIIREFNLTDIQAVFEFNSLAEVNLYTGDKCCTSLQDSENIIRDVWLHEYEKFGFGRWAVELKETGQVIGFCGFKNDSRIQLVDIGYRFLPQYWGMGIATESMQACMAYAKTHMSLSYIVAEAVSSNEASMNVMRKLGFKFNKQYEDEGYSLCRYDITI